MPAKSFVRAWVGAFTFALVAGLGACNNPFSSDDGTRVRLRNASAFELTSVTFNPGSRAVQFDRIAPGEVTEYRSVPHAYRYGMLDALVGGAQRRIQPIDYVGESVVGDGKFTYVITADQATRNLETTLIRD